MSKKLVNSFVVVIPAGQAVTGPPLAPILGQYGINTANFCKQFNDLSYGLDDFDDLLVYVPVHVELYDDKSYGLFLQKPSVSFLVKLAAAIDIGDSSSVRRSLNKEDLVRIARFKFPHMPLRSACRIILSVARSMGVYVAKHRKTF